MLPTPPNTKTIKQERGGGATSGCSISSMSVCGRPNQDRNECQTTFLFLLSAPSGSRQQLTSTPPRFTQMCVQKSARGL